MSYKGLMLIWFYFALGAGGFLAMLVLVEKFFRNVLDMMEGTTKIENKVLKDIERENKLLEREVDKFNEEAKEIENQNKLLRNVYFDKLIGEER